MTKRLLFSLFLFVSFQFYLIDVESSFQLTSKNSDDNIVAIYVDNNLLDKNKNIIDHDFSLRFVIDDELDMMMSYIKVNGEPIDLNFTKENSEQYIHNLKINDVGIYDIEYRLQFKNNASKSDEFTITREYSNEDIQVTFNDEIVTENNMQLYYAKPLQVQITIPKVTFLEATIKDTDDELAVDWIHDGFNHIATFSLSKEKQYRLELIINNEVQEIPINKKIFTIDITKPVADITQSNFIPYQNKDFTYAIMAKDINLDIDHSYIEINKDGISIKKSLYTVIQDAYFQSFTIKDEGSYVITPYIIDKAGNEAEINKTGIFTFVMDKTSPIIQANYKDDKETGYFNTNRNLAIKIEEINMSTDDIEIKVIKDNNDVTNDLTWIQDGKWFLSETILQDEGTYEIEINASDKAGNVTSKKLEPFIIDKTPPLIDLTGISQLAYVNKDVEVSLNIEDKFLSYYQIDAYCNGTRLELDDIPSIGSFTIASTLHFTDIDNADKADYSIAIKAQDLAGNIVEIVPLNFTIDKKAPVITSSLNQLDYQHNLTYAFSKDIDLNLKGNDAALYQQTVEVYKNAELIQSDKTIVTENTILYSKDFIPELSKEDTYLIHYSLVDKAGNVANEEITFILDTFLPDIEIANDVFYGKAYKEKWTPKLKYEGDAFQVLETTLVKDHKKIDYAWGDAIETEGEYELQVYVKDEAGNTGAMNTPFAFKLDQTPPAINFLNLQNNELINEYHEYQSLPLRVYLLNEDGSEQFVSIQINEEKLALKDVKKDEMLRSYIDVTLHDSAMYKIQVDAIDEAGNKSERFLQLQIAEASYYNYRNALLSGIVLITTAVVFIFKKSLLLRFS